MALPEPPEENGAFEKYELPTWAIYVSGGGLLLVTLCVSYTLQVEPIIGVVPFIVAAVFGLLGSIFAHETFHYKTAEILGYDPTYVWPTHVYVPDVHLPFRDIVALLLAPQILTIFFVALLLLDLDTGLRLMIGIAFVTELPSSCDDFLWTIQRIRWPEGTQVVVSGGDQETYVSFPN